MQVLENCWSKEPVVFYVCSLFSDMTRSPGNSLRAGSRSVMILGDTLMGGWVPGEAMHVDAHAEEVPLGGAGTCHPRVLRFCGFTLYNSWAEYVYPPVLLAQPWTPHFLPDSRGP